MKYLSKVYLFLLIIYSHIKKVKLDLPVHCLGSKVEGNWIFYLGDNNHDKDLKCGHKRPDQNLDHYNIDVEKIFKHKHEVIVKLERPDKIFSIKDNRQIGKWTMIYDEGFEFTIYDQVFFAFNRYKKTGRFSASNTDTEDTKGYMNICNKTFLGWFHNKFTNGEWGCFWGEKIENNKLKNLDIDKINYRNIFGLNKIPEVSGKRRFNDKNTEKDKNNEDNEDKEIDNDSKQNNNDLSTLKNIFINNSKLRKNNSNIRNNESQLEINKYKNNDNNSNKSNNSRKNEMNKAKNNENSDEENSSNNDQLNKNGSFSYVDFLKSLRSESSKPKYSNIPHLDIYFLNNDSESDSNDKDGNGFLELNSSTKLFQPDYDYVNKINNPKNNYLWTAKIHDDFTGKSYSQMRNLLGNVNFIKSSFFDSEHDQNESNNNSPSDNFKQESKNGNGDGNGINKLTEKEKLISTSKNDIKNFLQYASFLEFDIDVETSSFLNTESNSDLLSKVRERSRSKASHQNNESKSEFEMEMDSEEFEQTNKNIKNNYNSSKNKNGSRKNKNDLKKESQDSDGEDSDNEIDIELSEDLNTQKDDNRQNGKYGKLPLEFDWRNVDGTNYDSPVRKQGECGSCYAIAATSVLETRIRIKSNNRLKPLLSPSSILSCSRYNQGCYGGYPYLVGKFGKEFGFVDESCQPYSETDDKCYDFCFHEKKWKVKSYGYVGGYYGGCDEEAMMREIYDNGPIIVALNATPELYYYSKGIFHSEAKKTEGKLEKNVKPWEYTNHAVVCLGWGEETINDNTVKFWILKNSWGTNWGDNGYFKLNRGSNMASIEAQGVYITPDLE